jgi:aminoglycoside 6'-N-acetyltransferase I
MDLQDAPTPEGDRSDNRVRLAVVADRDQIAVMCALLWPESSAAEHGEEIEKVLVSGAYGTMPAAIFVSQGNDGELTGFLEVSLRSHADGCDPSRPVGFVEGWFVRVPFRKRGIGRALMSSAERWAGMQGCVEMASDTWIDEESSQQAHLSVGFEVVDRCVHFRKGIEATGRSIRAEASKGLR